ncbi:hypothetical protein PIB30_021309 [Stylosanthes scabra]|uniref:Uncharacterized protein n=1 Tax=Stylosanthes scabra TaxID=79078 RepID=A0ABU6Z5F6_9FABA|nr:hypothetical protein [Stylosanthes scabra]
MTSIDNKKHPINLLAVVQRPNETTRKYIERFNAECKTIDGLVDGAASLCLTNGLANDDFRKQLTTKPVWTRKEMQAKAKEFIHHEEIIRKPRNAGRERSEGPETRNPRNFRDNDESVPIVPVITGANHVEKSKSAHKKDLKILATVKSAPPQFPTITFQDKDLEH